MRLICFNIFILLANLWMLLIGAGNIINAAIVVLYIVMLGFLFWRLRKEREYERVKLLQELAE